MAVIGATDNLGFIAARRASGHGDGEDSEKRDFVRMRNKQADGAAVDRAAESSDEIIERCLQRPSDAHLRHDDGRQYHPQRQGKLQGLCKRKSPPGQQSSPLLIAPTALGGDG